RKISRNRTELKTMSQSLASEGSNPAGQERSASSIGQRGDATAEPAPSSALRPVVLAVVATAEVLLQPDVQADEEIAAAHLLELQLGPAGPPVAPGDRDHRPAEAPHDRLERQLHRQVEVGRDQRPAAVDDLLAIGLERVGRVVQPDGEQRLDEEVRHAVEEPLDPGIVDHPAALLEPAAEHAIVSLAQ